MRVVVAEDSVLLREGLVSLLAAKNFDVVAQVGSAEELLMAVARHEPRVVLTDIRMPPTHTDEGLRAAEALARSRPRVGVLVLSQYVQPEWAERLLRGGTPGRGYLLKEHVSRIDVLPTALRQVAAGGSYVDPAVFEELVRGGREDETLGALTRREREILALMAEGRSNGAIAELCHLSPKTVESHVSRIFRELDIVQTPDDHRRVVAVLRYLRASSAGSAA